MQAFLIIAGVLAGLALFGWLVWASTNAEMDDIQSDDPERQRRGWDHW